MGAVSTRAGIERRLGEVGRRLAKARAELVVIDEQRAALASDADEASVRALVSDHKADERSRTEAKRAVDAMDRSRLAVLAEIEELIRARDDLLERLPL
jgi:folate-dependent phosphoribosylglycinamide formyltransferase PurN